MEEIIREMDSLRISERDNEVEIKKACIDMIMLYLNERNNDIDAILMYHNINIREFIDNGYSIATMMTHFTI